MDNSNNPNQATRFNGGKVDYTLLPLDSLTAEAMVWQMGERKYGRHNWEKLWGKDTPQVAMASALRHIFAYLSGEEYDQESGLHHLAHVRCNCAMGIRHSNEKRQKEQESTTNLASQQRLTPVGRLP